MNANPATLMLTPQEIADRLRVSKRCVERWIQNKDLPSFRKGDPRVSEEDLTKFVLLNTVKAKRPDWVTPEVETDFWVRVANIVKREVAFEVEKHKRERIAA